MMVEKQHPKNWIKEIRKARKLKTKDVGDLIGTSASHVTMLENGRRGLTVPMVKKLAVALQCTPADITDGPGTAIYAKDSEEQNLILFFRALSAEKKNRILGFIEGLSGTIETN